MEIAVVVLLISTLTATGLVALWAATSQRPWHVRAAAPVTMIAPLAFVPAVEPMAALAIASAAVALGAAAWRRAHGVRRDAKPPAAWRVRFSVASLLAAMTLVGGALTLAVKADDLNDGWQSVAVIGLGGAGAVLLGAWAALLRGRKRWLAAPIALGLSYALAAGVARADWFAPSMMYRGIGWPPNSLNLALTGFGWPGPDLALWMWYAVLPAVTAATFAIVWLARAAGDDWSWRGAPQNRGRHTAAAFAVALSTVVALPAAATLYKMLTPEAIPAVSLPRPNAFDDLMAAGDGIGQATVKPQVNFYNCDPYYLTREELASALAKVAPSMRQLHEGLGKPCLLPIDYIGEAPLSEEYFGHMHCLRQALTAEARLAELAGDIDRSLAVSLDLLQLGFLCRRGGLLSHAGAGALGSGAGVYAIRSLRHLLNKEQCLAAVARIEALETTAEPFAAFAHRDYVQQLHGNGWHGRLYTILSTASEPQRLEIYEQSFILEQAKIQLLKAHLWLRAYLSEHEDLPQSWKQVTDAGLPALPVDPWDASGRPLHYKRQGKDYWLYSVGPNGIDDGGARPANATFYGLQKTGDYHVDLFGRE